METCVLSTNISGRKTPKLSVGLSRVISNKRNAAMESETNMNGSSEDQAVPVSEEILQEETDNKNEQSSDEHNISESPNRGKKRKLDENDDTTNENTTEESNEVPKDTENDNTSNVQNEDSVPESTEGDKEPDPTLQESENTENKTEPVSKPKAKPRSAPKPKRRSTFFTRKKSARKAPRSSMLADEPADEMDINDDAEKVQVKEEVDTGDEIKDNSELRTDDATEVPMSSMDVDKNEDTLSQNDVNSSAASSPAVARLSQKSVRSNRNNSPAAEFAKKSKVVPDLTNPVYLKPFEYGWRRELVYRSSYDSSGKRNGDVYYVAPTGKKLRSMREVVQNIRGKELSEDNFTFCKETLGLNDPEKEIVRDAKVKGTPGPATPTAITKKTEKPKKGLFSPKVASPKGAASPKIVPSPSQSPNSATITPKLGKSPRLSSGFKVKSTGARLSQGTPRSVKASRKNKRPAEEPIEDLQMGMLPPERSLTKKISSPSRQTKKQAAEVGAAIVKTTTNTKSKRIAQKSNTVSTVKATESQESRFMQYFIMHVSVGYTALLQVFQYLKVQELLRAGRVCRLWRDIAGHTSLWRTVRMKNSQVCDWDGLAESLQRHGTRTLDLRKMLIPGNGDEMWLKFSKAIGKAEHLTRIELCRCPATVVEELANSNPKLQIINAVTIKCDSINLEGFGNFQNLKELRLKSQNGMELSSDLSAFKSLTNLKHLSLTSIKKLGKKDVGVIADLVDLQSLELGECNELPDNFGTDVLLKLEKLTSLRLEKGQGSCCTFNILEAVSKLPLVEQLELVNFDVKVGFDKAMALCTNIKRLLIIPTYISQSATTNHMVLGGVLQLTASLSHFVWGVTLELLRVTELFVDQCDQTPKGSPQSPTKKEKKTSGSGDSIPVLKPVPFLEKKDNSSEDTTAKDNPQVEILPLPALQKLLSEKLPTTRVKILKIPFHATWRQSITDSVN